MCMSLHGEMFSRALQNSMELMCAVSGAFSRGMSETVWKQNGGVGPMPAVFYKQAWRHAQGAKTLMRVPELVM